MRICISSLPIDTFGGAERVVVSDAQHFAQAGHEVHLIANTFDSRVLSSYGLRNPVETHQISTSDRSPLMDTLSRVYEIRSLLSTLEPDVVIAHYQEIATWLALATLEIDPVFASHVHGSLFWFQNKTNRGVHMWKECARELVAEVPGHSEFWTVDNVPFTQKGQKSVAELLEMMALRSCDEVFVNTEQVARELRCLYGIRPEVNPPGIDEDHTTGSKDPELPVERPFVFSLSRLDERKRIDLLITAFAELRGIRSGFNLVIGGTGDQEEPLKRLATEKGVRNAVRFVGHVDEALLPTYYRQAEVFACPGWMSYGLTPLEAVRARTKVALSTDAFVKEVIGDQPGVEVLDPEVGAWVDGLDRLVECDECPSPSDLPRVDEHADAKLSAFESG